MSQDVDIRTSQQATMEDDLTPTDAIEGAEPGVTCVRFRVDPYDTYRYAAKIPQAVLQDTWAVYYPVEDVSHLIEQESLVERLRCCESIALVDESSVEGFA